MLVFSENFTHELHRWTNYMDDPSLKYVPLKRLLCNAIYWLTYMMTILFVTPINWIFSQAITITAVLTVPKTMLVSWHFSMITERSGDSRYKCERWQRCILTALCDKISPVWATVRRHTWLQIILFELLK